jgi:hypothetical protein
MPAINFDDVFNTLKQGVIDLAMTTGVQFAKQAESDGQTFLNDSKQNLQNWTDELCHGKLSKDDFTDLLLGQKDLFALTALKQAGYGEIAADNFKTGVFDLIQKTVLSLI